MEEQQAIQQQYRQQQEKLIYYLIALAVAAIGFSILQTIGQPIKRIQIPLAFAVLCWGISIYLGIRFLKLIISSLFANNVYLDILQGRDPRAGQHPEMIRAASSGVKEAMETNSNRASESAKWQERLFYLGIILFIIWRIAEMYEITIIK